LEKTNATRFLTAKKIPFVEHKLDIIEAVDGVTMANMLSQPTERVFKTLVTVGKSGNHYVFMVPVAEELDLKKGSTVTGEKSLEMLKSKDLLPLTGYVHGGCSPIGMKKFFPTFIHNTADNYQSIFFSGGKIGYQVETSLADLKKIIKIEEADIIK